MCSETRSRVHIVRHPQAFSRVLGGVGKGTDATFVVIVRSLSAAPVGALDPPWVPRIMYSYGENRRRCSYPRVTQGNRSMSTPERRVC